MQNGRKEGGSVGILISIRRLRSFHSATIGTTGPSDALTVIGDVNASGCFQTAGTTVGGSCVSDLRLKENISPLKNTLSTLSKLTPVRFNFINGTNPQLGLIAQEVEQVLPEYVETDKEGFKKVKYSVEFDMLLIQAVKELEQENEALKSRIEALERNAAKT